ncbi:MAG: ATPase domain-containing protein [Candidatus Bathyarchaeia archaeon]
MNRVIPTGCGPIDDTLRGGIPLSAISLVYGESSSGRTSFALQCAVSCARCIGPVLFVLSEHLANVERLSRITEFEKAILKRIVLFLPRSFEEQRRIVDDLNRSLASKFRLIIFDTVTELYHIEQGSLKETIVLNRELNRQLALMKETALQKGVAFLLTAQVHATLDEDEIEPVANRILRYWSDVVLRLEKTPTMGVRRARLEKLMNREQRKSCYFRMTERGIQSI